MFLRSVLLFYFGFLTVACAEPNYQDINSIQQESTNSKNTACDLIFKENKVCVSIKWEVMPTESEEGSFLMHFSNLENPTVLIDPPYFPFVQLWMNSMGHGSSPVKTEKVTEGIYRATNVYFIMHGDWDIRIQFRDGNNVIDQVLQKIRI